MTTVSALMVETLWTQVRGARGCVWKFDGCGLDVSVGQQRRQSDATDGRIRRDNDQQSVRSTVGDLLQAVPRRSLQHRYDPTTAMMTYLQRRMESAENNTWKYLSGVYAFCSWTVLPRDAMRKRGLCCWPVSVRLSRSGIVSRRLKISSNLNTSTALRVSRAPAMRLWRGFITGSHICAIFLNLRLIWSLFATNADTMSNTKIEKKKGKEKEKNTTQYNDDVDYLHTVYNHCKCLHY